MKKCAGKLNTICRLKSVLKTDQRKIRVNRFIYAHYNCYPLVRHFCSTLRTITSEIFKSLKGELHSIFIVLIN